MNQAFLGQEVTSQIIDNYNEERYKVRRQRFAHAKKFIISLLCSSFITYVIINNQYGSGKRSVTHIITTQDQLVTKFNDIGKTDASIHSKMLLGGDVIEGTKVWDGTAYLFGPTHIAQHIKNLTLNT